MTLRRNDTDGRNPVHVEVARPDELPMPVPATEAEATAPLAFREGHKIADSATAKELGRRGGEARARNVRLVDALGLAKLQSDTAFAPYRSAADEFHRHHVAELAKQAGGECGAAPSSMVASAALQLAASRFLFDEASKTGSAALFKQASTLANDSRQNLIAAYEIAVREGHARRLTAQQSSNAQLYTDGKASS